MILRWWPPRLFPNSSTCLLSCYIQLCHAKTIMMALLVTETTDHFKATNLIWLFSEDLILFKVIVAGPDSRIVSRDSSSPQTLNRGIKNSPSNVSNCKRAVLFFTNGRQELFDILLRRRWLSLGPAANPEERLKKKQHQRFCVL